MTEQTVSPVNYDYSSPVHSPFLRLKGKGDTCKIRIVSEPVKFMNTYQGKESERYAWLVIDRSSEVEDEYFIKIFQGGAQIWNKIKSYVKNEEWGDPMTYDLTIERTETSPANYYDVTPSPSNKGPLTTEEMALVMACNIDLAKAVEPKVK